MLHANFHLQWTGQFGLARHSRLSCIGARGRCLPTDTRDSISTSYDIAHLDFVYGWLLNDSRPRSGCSVALALQMLLNIVRPRTKLNLSAAESR